jgi:hypothetical protein
MTRLFSTAFVGMVVLLAVSLALMLLWALEVAAGSELWR